MVLNGIPSVVEANNLQYSVALQNTLLDIYNTIFTSDTFRYDSRNDHLKYCDQSSVIATDTRVSFSLHYNNLATLYSLVVPVLEQTGKTKISCYTNFIEYLFSLLYTRSSFYMELTYTTPEALREKQFTASRDPSFSDVRDYLIFPSTAISATSDVRKVLH